MPYIEFVINQVISYLSIINIVFVDSETNFNDVDQKISNKLKNNNFSDWNVSDSSSDNNDNANEYLIKKRNR